MEGECRAQVSHSGPDPEQEGSGWRLPEGSTRQEGGTGAEALSRSCFCFVQKLWFPEWAGKKKGQGKHVRGGEDSLVVW